jgi:hypothetical protein
MELAGVDPKLLPNELPPNDSRPVGLEPDATLTDGFWTLEPAPKQGLLHTLRALPKRTPFGFGLGAGLLVLLLQATMWSAFGLLALFIIPALFIGIGLLAGLAVPGLRAWLGLSIGLIAAAIIARVISAIFQPDLYYIYPVIARIVEDAVTVLVLASFGFAIGVIVRRLR